MGQVKQIKGRLIAKHETEAVWDGANGGAGVQYIPAKGEHVLYDPDENHQETRVKYGDGEHIVKDLPFASGGIPLDENGNLIIDGNLLVKDALNVGENNINITRGYYISGINFNTDTDGAADIILSESQPTLTYNEAENRYSIQAVIDYIVPEWECKGNYPHHCTFRISNNYDYVEFKRRDVYENIKAKLPFTEEEFQQQLQSLYETYLRFDSQGYPYIALPRDCFFIYCVEESTIGPVFHEDSFCSVFGKNNQANFYYSFAAGLNNKATGKYSVAFGGDNIVGYAGFSSGRNNQVLGTDSHANGLQNIIKHNATAARASGVSNIVYGKYSSAEGQGTISGLNKDTIATHTEGQFTKAYGNISHAEGAGSEAQGVVTHAEGNKTKAIGAYSHSQNAETVANGAYSHAGGYKSITAKSFGFAHGNEAKANGESAVAFGTNTQANGSYSFAIGQNSKATGSGDFAAGLNSEASGGNGAAALGLNAKAKGGYSFAAGFDNDTSGALGAGSFKFGYASTASKNFAFAGGNTSIADGESAIALGAQARAIGYARVAIGCGLVAEKALAVVGKYNIDVDAAFVVGAGASAFDLRNSFVSGLTKTEINSTTTAISGDLTIAKKLTVSNSIVGGAGSVVTGADSIACGQRAHASGGYAAAFGYDPNTTTGALGAGSLKYGHTNTASGVFSMAGGNASKALGRSSVAIGQNVTANNDNSAVFGIWNTTNSNALFQVGNGTSSAPSDALIVRKDGTASIGAQGKAYNDIATVKFVKDEVASLIDSAPEALNTLGELATALKEHEDTYDALLEVVGNKVDKIAGKGLSTKDYTEEDKTKVDLIQPNWIDVDLGIADGYELTIKKIFVDDIQPIDFHISSYGGSHYVDMNSTFGIRSDYANIATVDTTHLDSGSISVTPQDGKNTIINGEAGIVTDHLAVGEYVFGSPYNNCVEITNNSITIGKTVITEDKLQKLLAFINAIELENND